MRLESELDKLGIKYQSSVINGSKIIECANGTRVHIYKNYVGISYTNGYQCLPPNEKSLQYVLGVIKSYE